MANPSNDRSLYRLIGPGPLVSAGSRTGELYATAPRPPRRMPARPCYRDRVMHRLLADAVPISGEAAQRLARHTETRAILMILGVVIAALVAIIVITMVRVAARPRPTGGRRGTRDPAVPPRSAWEEAGRRAAPLEAADSPDPPEARA